MKGSRQASSLAVAVAAAGLAFACSRPRPTPSEEPPAPRTSPALEAPPQLRQLPQARPEDVQEVVKRIFKDAASADAGGQAIYAVGDFNGDLSQDIAIVVRPVPGRLAEMNDSPRWMLKDPFQPDQPGAPPLRVEADQPLLAVVHGDGPDGWRNPEATQTWLLKNAAASGMQARPGRDFLAANKGRPVPRIHGDVIEAVLRGAPGDLYYTGASYRWYDPKTFVAEPEPRVAHRPPAR